MPLEGFSLAATTSDLSEEPKAREHAAFVEFQMGAADSPLAQLKEYNGELPLIVTNRPYPEGNNIDSKRLNELVEAADFDPVGIVEIELSDAKLHERILSEIQEKKTKTIISYHNPTETPSDQDLTNIIEQCSEMGDIVKVSVFAETRLDTLDLLNAVHVADRKGIEITGVSMGNVGRHTRIAAPFYGSKIGYAPIDIDQSKVASGQIELKKLASLIEDMDSGTEHVEMMDVLKDKF